MWWSLQVLRACPRQVAQQICVKEGEIKVYIDYSSDVFVKKLTQNLETYFDPKLFTMKDDAQNDTRSGRNDLTISIR